MRLGAMPTAMRRRMRGSAVRRSPGAMVIMVAVSSRAVERWFASCRQCHVIPRFPPEYQFQTDEKFAGFFGPDCGAIEEFAYSFR